MGGTFKGREYVYTYGRLTLRFDRKQQNSVKQLSFNKKIKFLKSKQKKQNIKIWVKIYKTWQQKAVIKSSSSFDNVNAIDISLASWTERGKNYKLWKAGIKEEI